MSAKQVIKGHYVSSMSSLAKKINEDIERYNAEHSGKNTKLVVNRVTSVICENQMIDSLVVYDVVD